MKTILFLFILSIPGIVKAQENKGIIFEHAKTWAEIRAKAKAENKFIFIDAFATWCGPCKVMSENVFTLPEVGDFFNANFINLKVQMDVTRNDNAEIRQWYAAASAIKELFKVNVFPTYLFLNPDGQLVHRSVGSSAASTFIRKGQDALLPEKQYYTLRKEYTAGNREPAFLLALVKATRESHDYNFIPEITRAYLQTQNTILELPYNFPG